MALINRRRLIAMSLIAAVSPAWAQDYPARPVTIIVPFAAGGGTDVLARILARKLEQRLGKSFLIDNRGGAGTVIGAAAAAKAAHDGYTLLQATSSTLAMNPSIYKSLSYDPAKDFVPVALVCSVPFVLVVNSASPVRSVADLIKLAKEKPLNYGSAGPGAFHHLNSELFSSMIGAKFTHVAYRGGALAITDLVAGRLDFMFTDLAPALELIRSGQLRALGVTTAVRAAAAPDIPPLADVGLPGYDAAAWQMLAAPAQTPRPILVKLNAEVNAIVNEPDTQKQFVDLGLIPIGKGSLEEHDKFVKAETIRWGKVVHDAGIAGSQ
jgi:tripartite-type tricarboxylate transporter receptor subunit TctC